MKYFIYWIEHQDNFGFEQFEELTAAEVFIAKLPPESDYHLIRGMLIRQGETYGQTSQAP